MNEGKTKQTALVGKERKLKILKKKLQQPHTNT